MTSTGHDVAKAENTGGTAKRRRRIRNAAIVVVAVVLLYTLGGFFGVPWLVKGPILSRVNERLNGVATIEKVTCNPYTLHLVIRGVRVADGAGADVAKVGEVDVNASLWRTIWRPGYQAQWAIVRDVWAKAEVGTDGAVSVASLIKPGEPAKPGEKPTALKRWPRFVVETCRVERVNLELGHALDKDHRYATTIKDATVNADGLDLGPTNISTITVAAKSERGEAFDVIVELLADPMTLLVDARGKDVSLNALSDYGIVYAGLNVRLTQGKADAELVVDFKPSESAPVARADIKRVTARDVRVEYVEGAYEGMTSSDVPRIDIEDAAADVVARKLSVKRVALIGTSAFVRRNEAGQLDVETVVRVTKEAGEEIAALAAGQLIASIPTGVTGATPGFEIPTEAKGHEYPIERIARGVRTIAASARGAWDVEATKVDVEGATAAWQDAGAPGAVAVAMTNSRVEAGPILSAKRFEIPVKVETVVGGGSVRVEGVVRPMDLELDATVKAENVDGAAVAGYVPTKLATGLDQARLAKALLNAEGRLTGKVVLAEKGEPTIDGRWDGRAGMNDVELMQGEAKAIGVASAAAVGVLTARGPISTLEIAWDGTAQAQGLDATVAIDGPEAGPVTLAMETGSLSGTATATVRKSGIGLVTQLGAEASGIRAAAPGVRDLKASVGRAQVQEIALDLDGNKARIGAVALDNPSASMRVPVLPANKAKEAAAPGASTYIGIPAPMFQVDVGEVALRGASAVVEDPNTAPPMVMAVDRVDATLTGIATREGAPIRVQLAGMVQESGRVSIDGSVDLFRAMPSGSVRIDVASMPMTGFDAATGRFLGYEVDRGRATVEMPLELKEGELSGTARINLDRFYLGDEVESDEALNVPVQLGLSLLRDTNEQIDATVGIKGRIDEPGFTIAGLVWKAIANLIVKAATAPFEILGSIFGGDGTDLSRVAFENGTDRLGAASLAQLDTMAKAMRERPGLRLKVVAQASGKADVPVLKREGLRAWVLDVVRKRDPRVVTLTEDQYRAQVSDAFLVQATGLTPEAREATAFEAREAFLLERVVVTKEQLIALANTRAQRVADVLTKEGRVQAERVSIELATAQTDEVEQAETRFELQE